MTTVCQTLTTAILSLLAASLSVVFIFYFLFFSVDALPLIQFLLVFQALNSKLGRPEKASFINSTHSGRGGQRPP